MQPTKITWIGFLLALSALSIPTKTIAHESNSLSENKSQPIESRLERIAKTLQQKEKELSNDLFTKDNIKNPIQIAGGFANRSGGGGFANRSGGGGFVNAGGGWADGGGFVNRRY